MVPDGADRESVRRHGGVCGHVGRPVRLDGPCLGQDGRRHPSDSTDDLARPADRRQLPASHRHVPVLALRCQQPRRCCRFDDAATRHRVDGRLRIRPHPVSGTKRALRPVPGHDDDPAAGRDRSAVHRDAQPRPRRLVRRLAVADDRLQLRRVPPPPSLPRPATANSTKRRSSMARGTSPCSPASCSR